MDRSKIINCIAFTVGAVAGSAVTYFALRKKFEEIANDLVEDELKEVRAMYREKLENIAEKEAIKKEALDSLSEGREEIVQDDIIEKAEPISNKFAEKESSDNEFISNDIPSLANKVTKATVEKTKDKPPLTDYTKAVKNMGYMESTDKDGDEVPQVTGEPKTEKITIIAPEDYGEEENYDQIDLVYYADGILADDANEVIEKPERLVGDALTRFGEYEDDAVHVKNDDMETYYEILLDIEPYFKKEE